MPPHPRFPRNVPPHPVRPPHPRHWLARVHQRSLRKETNTVIESWVNVAADIAAINRGEAVRRGGRFEINGRIYGLEAGGRAYPISGPGFHTLDRGAFRALGVYNQFGLTPNAEWILGREGIGSDARGAARAAFLAERAR